MLRVACDDKVIVGPEQAFLEQGRAAVVGALLAVLVVVYRGWSGRRREEVLIML